MRDHTPEIPADHDGKVSSPFEKVILPGADSNPAPTEPVTESMECTTPEKKDGDGGSRDRLDTTGQPEKVAPASRHMRDHSSGNPANDNTDNSSPSPDEMPAGAAAPTGKVPEPFGCPPSMNMDSDEGESDRRDATGQPTEAAPASQDMRDLSPEYPANDDGKIPPASMETQPTDTEAKPTPSDMSAESTGSEKSDANCGGGADDDRRDASGQPEKTAPASKKMRDQTPEKPADKSGADSSQSKEIQPDTTEDFGSTNDAQHAPKEDETPVVRVPREFSALDNVDGIETERTRLYKRRMKHVLAMENMKPRRYRSMLIKTGADDIPAFKTLYGWRKKYKEDERQLIGMQHCSGMRTTCPNWAMDFYGQFRAEHPEGKYSRAYAALEKHAKEKGIPVDAYPSQATFRRLFKCVGKDAETYILKGAAKHFDKHGVTTPQIVLRPNAVWQCDCKALDMYVIRMSDGKKIKPWVVTFLDMASRMMMGWHVFDHEPKTKDVLLTLKHALLPTENKPWFGKPAKITTDNGRHFQSEYETVLLSLGIQYHSNNPHRPTENGRVERIHKTYDAEFSRCFFDGVHKTLSIKAEIQESGFDEILERLPTSFDSFAKHYCRTRPHQSLAGATPYEYYRDNVDVSTLQLARPEVDRKVVESVDREVLEGYVEVKGRYYSSGRLVRHEGRTVKVMYPPEGPTSGKVWAFYNDLAIDEAGLRCHEDDSSLAEELRNYYTGKTQDLREVTAAMRGIRGPQARREKNEQAARERAGSPEVVTEPTAEAPKKGRKQLPTKVKAPTTFPNLRKSTTK